MLKACVLSAELFSLQLVTTEFVWQSMVFADSVGQSLTHVVTHSDCISPKVHLIAEMGNR